MDQQSPIEQFRTDVVAGWKLHRPYVLGSVGLFAVGLIIGIALWLGDVDLIAMMGLEDPSEAFPDEFTVRTILMNNTLAFVILIVGFVTLGMLTVFGVVFNGVFIGFLVPPIAADIGVGAVLLALIPHGILELPAIFVAAGVGFRLVHVVVDRVRGARDQLLSAEELRQTIVLVAVAWLVLAVAAVIEVHVTPAIVDAVFGHDPDVSL